MDLTNQKVSGINEINLQDSLNAAVLEMKIKVGEDTVAPEGDDLIIYVDKESYSNPTSDRKQYVFNLSSSLKSLGTVSDELIQLIDVKNNESKLITYIRRNIGTNDSGNYTLSQPVTEDIESIDITLFEGANYIYTNYLNAEITILYPKDNDFNRMFLNSSIYNKHRKLNNEIYLDDIYFKDAFSKIGDELNEEIDNLNVKCITSKNNKFSLDSNGNLIVNSITTNNISSSQTNVDQDVIRDFIYPVGSIYMSVNSINPNTIFGGTWEQLKDRFLLGAGDTYVNGNIGGESTHQLITSEIPRHTHRIYTNKDSESVFNSKPKSQSIGVFVNEGQAVRINWQYNGSTIARDTEFIGENTAHNNMPPYLVVYMWKRIS